MRVDPDAVLNVVGCGDPVAGPVIMVGRGLRWSQSVAAGLIRPCRAPPWRLVSASSAQRWAGAFGRGTSARAAGIRARGPSGSVGTPVPSGSLTE
jgi:hypothetical protein